MVGFTSKLKKVRDFCQIENQENLFKKLKRLVLRSQKSTTNMEREKILCGYEKIIILSGFYTEYIFCY